MRNGGAEKRIMKEGKTRAKTLQVSRKSWFSRHYKGGIPERRWAAGYQRRGENAREEKFNATTEATATIPTFQFTLMLMRFSPST
jgi:hypothetical protein